MSVLSQESKEQILRIQHVSWNITKYKQMNLIVYSISLEVSIANIADAEE